MKPGPTYFEVLKRRGAGADTAVAVTSGIDRLHRAASYTSREDCRWSALCPNCHPSRLAHLATALCNQYQNLAEGLATWRPRTKAALGNAERCMELLEGLDALRRDEPFNGFCEAAAAWRERSGRAPACHLLRQARRLPLLFEPMPLSPPG